MRAEMVTTNNWFVHKLLLFLMLTHGLNIPIRLSYTGVILIQMSGDTDGKFLICNSGSAIVLTVPSDATAGWIDAVTHAACRKGVGAVTFAAGAGVTLRGDLATPAQYGSKGIVRIGTNEWTVIA